MVEIIRRGQIPEERIHETECSRCKTLFRFVEREAKHNPGHSQRDEEHWEIDCPVCCATCFSYRPLKTEKLEISKHFKD